MPAKSKAQQHLMAAAAHGAQFPMAKKVRAGMSLAQLGHFAETPTKGLPTHVGGSHPHRGKNLGKFLHPKRGR